MDIQGPARTEPRTMVLFGKPKVGKTTVCADLTTKRNFLLIELEKGGADAVQARKVQITNLNDLFDLCKQVKADKAKYNFEGCIIDTCTKLEEMSNAYAIKLYKETAMGRNYEGTDITTLPQGAGYMWIRKAFLKIMTMIENTFDRVIYIAHTTEKTILKKGEEASSQEISLGGKLSAIFAAQIDSIGYVFRDENATKINFKSSTETVCGNRFPYLADEIITIAESDEKKDITFHWESIFPSMKEKQTNK